jgi:hypothetical protein
MAVLVKLNHNGVRQLLQSPGVLAELKRRGERIAAAAGPGFEAEGFVGRNRARVTVRTATVEAMVAQAEDDVLTKAIPAGR